MAEHSPDTDELVRYLLGDSPEEERQRVERDYFENETSYRRLLEIEDDLAGRWARGELTGSQREHFGTRLLSSEAGRAKAEFAQALAEVAQRLEAATALPSVPKTHGILRWLPVAAVLAVAVPGGIELRRLQLRVSALDAQLEAARAASGRVSGQALLSFVLAPGLTRGPEALRRLAIPSGGESVRFQLQVPVALQGGPLTARLVLADGRELWSGMAIGSDRTTEVIVPGKVLTPEEYDLILERPGETGHGVTYHFAVSRR